MMTFFMNYLQLSLVLLASALSAQCLNDRPIIGILAQETSRSWGQNFPNYTSFVAASYVKWVEGSGARAVPIKINENRSYYEDLIRNVNGILYPGGAVSLNDSGFHTAGSILYEEAIKLNEKGTYFPMWTTCLGFELFVHLVAQENNRVRCDSHDQPLNLDMTNETYGSMLLGDLPEDVSTYLMDDNVTANYHRYCFYPEQFIENKYLREKIRVLSTNLDWNGFKFVSSIEHKDYPFYGVQFHPEKPLYEWDPKRNKGTPHTYEAIRVSQYFGNFFINEARRNDNRFNSTKEEESHLFYQYEPVYSQEETVYEQIYLFE